MEFIRKVVDQPNLCLSPITDNPYNDFQFELSNLSLTKLYIMIIMYIIHN